MGDEISHAMGVIFIEDIPLAPVADGSNVDLGNLGADAPGYLKRRTRLVISGSSG